MIIVMMNIAKFFMGGKPIDEWSNADFNITNFSLLDELVRNQKVKSIGVALLPTDRISSKSHALEIRKICDWFRLPIMMSWSGYDYANHIMCSTDKELTESHVDYVAVIASDENNGNMTQLVERSITYSLDDDRDLVMEKIINQIVKQHNLLVSHIG